MTDGKAERKVLIVDDAPIIILGLGYAIAAAGFAVETAGRGEDAVALCKNTRYAAIILDCQMPEMDGFECAKQIRLLESQGGFHVPIIGFSSSSDRDIREHCLGAGMDCFLPKDCTQKEFSSVLKFWAIPADS